jgi:hypothetical protein
MAPLDQGARHNASAVTCMLKESMVVAHYLTRFVTQAQIREITYGLQVFLTTCAFLFLILIVFGVFS